MDTSQIVAIAILAAVIIGLGLLLIRAERRRVAEGDRAEAEHRRKQGESRKLRAEREWAEAELHRER